MNPQNLKVKQIKEVLRQQQLSTAGRKAELILRMQQADPSDDWVQEAMSMDVGHEEDQEESGPPSPVANPGNKNAKERAASSAESDVAEREQQLLLRERELMRKEIELLRRENEMLRASPQQSNISASSQYKVGIKSISELLSEYHGSGNDFPKWKAQVCLLRDTYELDDNLTKILISSKLKGKALRWLHSKNEHLQMSADGILSAMTIMFDQPLGRLELRRQFELRQWRRNESFADYCHEKLILGNQVPVSQDEVIDYIIEGIPSEQLRNQARMQCFSSIEDLLQGFRRITLETTKRSLGSPKGFQRKTIGDKTSSSTVSAKSEDSIDRVNTTSRSFKCYECKEPGHIARNCLAKKRTTENNAKSLKESKPGSKEQIGIIEDNNAEDETSFEEIIKEPKSDDGEIYLIDTQNEPHDEFKRIVDFKFSNNETITLTSRIDSGCPINLIKNKYVSKLVLRPANQNWQRYYGMNRSQVFIMGITDIQVTMESQTQIVSFGVVNDDSMVTPVLLGRDALRKFGYKLTKSPTYDKVVSEILHINAEVNESAILPKINPNLNIADKVNFENIFIKYYEEPVRPNSPEVKMEARIILKDNQLIQFKPRRLSYTDKEKVNNIIKQLKAEGIIRESSSEYSSPIVLVRKKNGEVRMCVDYRALNKIMARDNYPLPLIEDLLDNLRGKQYFSLMDLKNGFYHISMFSESIKYTSFVTPLGQYEYLKMPFGLKIGPQQFQRFINNIFAELIKSGQIMVYMDDLLVATEDLASHLKILTTVFKILVSNRLELRLEKCAFLSTEIDYLGYHITSKGISPTADGVIAVTDFPEPQTTKAVHSFVGLVSYFRKFISNFSVIAKPLYDLLKKNTEFAFKDVEREAFYTLKQKLIEAPVLAIYNPKANTEVHCDASAQGFGAVLLQQQENKSMHPIFYFSRRTTECESRYHSFELETLAVVYALRRFRIYLLGISFIISDCNAVTQTLEKRDINARIARWSIELQSYDFKIIHRQGTRMKHVDALSRSFDILVEDNPFEWNLMVCQKSDTQINEIAKKLEKTAHPQFELRDGLIYKKHMNRLLFMVPERMESHVLFHYHNEMGHVGLNKMVETISRTYWFPKIRKKCKTHIQNCLKCISFSPSSGKAEGYLNPIPKGNVPFGTIHIDHFGPVDHRVLTKKYIFLVVDAFTKFVRLYPTKTTNAKECISALINYFQAYSRPRVIISDRGSAFTSQEFEEFIKTHKITHVKVATGSPQANGQVERVNRYLGPMIAKCSDVHDGKPWYKVLAHIEYSINNTVNRSTNKTPFQLLFGIDQKGPIADELKILVTPDLQDSRQDLTLIRAEAAKNISQTQDYQKQAYDIKRKSPRTYAIGDLVMIRNFDSTAGVSKKIIPQFRGPYKVTKVLRNNRYVLSDVEGLQNTQRPYVGTWEAANMRPWIHINSL